MNTFLRIDTNLVAFTLLAAIYFIAKKQLDQNDSSNRSYLRVVLLVLTQLVIETLSCIINKKEISYLIPFAYFLNGCLFIVGALLSYISYILFHKLIVPYQEIEPKKLFILKIPQIINTILVVLSPLYGFVFYITKENVYHRGEFFFISISATYFYLILMLTLVIRNKKGLGEHEFNLLFVFVLFPIIGGIVQAIMYGELLMWSSVAFALVIMFAYLQQRMVHVDYLTGVWSRGSFEIYIKNRLLDNIKQNLGIIYCDIDRLKDINDEHGHLEGDEAIKMATSIIKSSIRKTDIMVRMGGDEFIVVLECEEMAIMVETLKRIEKSFEEYNKTSQKGYELSCSFGSDIMNSSYNTIEQFLHHVDILMYENKRLKKGSNRV